MNLSWGLLLPANDVCKGYVFAGVCLSVYGGACVVKGGMCGKGGGMHGEGGGACVVKGVMHGEGGCAW